MDQGVHWDKEAWEGGHRDGDNGAYTLTHPQNTIPQGRAEELYFERLPSPVCRL